MRRSGVRARRSSLRVRLTVLATTLVAVVLLVITLDLERVSAVEDRLTDAGAADAIAGVLPPRFRVLTGHKESAPEPPPGSVLLAANDVSPVQLYRVGEVLASQFHPEPTTTEFTARARAYQSYGYFPPEEFDEIAAAVHGAEVTLPRLLLTRFVERAELLRQLHTDAHRLNLTRVRRSAVRAARAPRAAVRRVHVVRGVLEATAGWPDAPVLACSSAGGGLRLAVVGYEELIGAEAGSRAALSASSTMAWWASRASPWS